MQHELTWRPHRRRHLAGPGRPRQSRRPPGRPGPLLRPGHPLDLPARHAPDDRRPAGENGVWLYDLWRTRQSIADLGRTWRGADAAARPAGDPWPGEPLLAPPWLSGRREILAYNVLALLSFVLTGYATFLYTLYITRNPYAAVVSGAILAFSPLRLHWLASGALPLLATQWLPLSLYWLERALREGRRRHAALAGAALGLAMLTTWGAAVVAAGA